MTTHAHILIALVAMAGIGSFAALAFLPAVGQLGDQILERAENSTTGNSSSTFITEEGTIDCEAVASELGGIAVPNGDVCDVVVVRQSPTVIGHNNMTMNQFTLMNSVLEFTIANTTMNADNSTNGNSDIFDNSTNGNSTNGNATEHTVYVMGDFALLETEMNSVLQVVTGNNWTVTGVHNHMINETPKMSFLHWEVAGDIDTIIESANEAFEATSIKGESVVE
jgi:hypothetical protein